LDSEYLFESPEDDSKLASLRQPLPNDLSLNDDRICEI
jgi:hypothetical protein